MGAYVDQLDQGLTGKQLQAMRKKKKMLALSPADWDAVKSLVSVLQVCAPIV